MYKNNVKIFKVFGLILIVVTLFLVGLYFSPLKKLFFPELKLPEIKKIGKEVLTPGVLISQEKKEIKEVLSKDEIIKITNQYRQQNNLLPLKENELLSKAAIQKIDDMLEKQYFDHISPEGKDVSDLLENVQYKYIVAGENLALGYFESSKDLVDAWMASPGHRENILNSKFKEIGVAQKIGMFQKKKQYLAVQVFATSIFDCPLPSENLKQKINNKENEISSFKGTVETLQSEINNLKSSISNLYSEITNLINEGKSLITQGNNLISKGNQVYARTRDRTAAEQYWSQGEVLQKQGQEKINEANTKNEQLKNLQNQLQQKINSYNSLIYQINYEQLSLKNLILEYNSQVENFNQCIGK